MPNLRNIRPGIHRVGERFHLVRFGSIVFNGFRFAKTWILPVRYRLFSVYFDSIRYRLFSSRIHLNRWVWFKHLWMCRGFPTAAQEIQEILWNIKELFEKIFLLSFYNFQFQKQFTNAKQPRPLRNHSRESLKPRTAIQSAVFGHMQNHWAFRRQESIRIQENEYSIHGWASKATRWSWPSRRMFPLRIR